MGLRDKLRQASDYLRKLQLSLGPDSYFQYKRGRKLERKHTREQTEDSARRKRAEADRGPRWSSANAATTSGTRASAKATLRRSRRSGQKSSSPTAKNNRAPQACGRPNTRSRSQTAPRASRSRLGSLGSLRT